MHPKSSILNTESMEFKNLENVENCFKYRHQGSSRYFESQFSTRYRKPYVVNRYFNRHLCNPRFGFIISVKNFDSEKWWYPYGGDQIGKKWIPNALNPINCAANEKMFKDIEIIFWIFFAQIIWGIFGTVVGCIGTMASNQSGPRNTVNGWVYHTV